MLKFKTRNPSYEVSANPWKAKEMKKKSQQKNAKG
jgi:hypothetical protein